MKDCIILIGFMGSGKTTVGKRLAAYLDWPLMDTDSLIEEAEGCTISTIFAERGEQAFRDMETAVLSRLLLLEEPERAVISAGGGMALREENRALMHRLGRVVYLEADDETLYARLRNDSSRPKLQGGDLRERIRTLRAQREAIYREAADIQIDTGVYPPPETARRIAGHTGYRPPEDGKGENHDC